MKLDMFLILNTFINNIRNSQITLYSISLAIRMRVCFNTSYANGLFTSTCLHRSSVRVDIGCLMQCHMLIFNIYQTF